MSVTLVRTGLRGPWILACATGAALGFGGAAAIGASAAGSSPATRVVAATAAGCVLGLGLAVLQATVIRRRVDLRVGLFLFATVAVSAPGWLALGLADALGFAGTAAGSPSPLVLGLAAAGAGLAMGTLLAVAQGLTLTVATHDARGYILGTAVAWVPVMVVVVTAAAALPAGAGIFTAGATGGVAGAAAGALLGLMTASAVDGLRSH